MERVGVSLETACFSHGQLYVAASRVGHPDNIRFCVAPDGDGRHVTHNVVYPEVLPGAAGGSSTASVQRGESGAAGWGDFDENYGEYRSTYTEAERDCAPQLEHGEPLTCVPVEQYRTLSAAAIVEGNITCEGFRQEPFELARERLWLFWHEFEPGEVERMSPYEVLMNAPEAELHSVPTDVYRSMSTDEVVEGGFV